MVDIHSHVLWGLDDGARNIEDSLAMLRIAAESGTTDIVATPHANLDYKFQPLEISARIAELRSKGVTVPRVHSGCDFHLHFDNISDAVTNPAKYAIDGKNYLMVEFSDLLIFKTTDQIFEQLLGAGLRPVITHPERNALLRDRLPEIEKWVAQGVYCQITGLSLTGRFGSEARAFSDELIRRRLAHVIASDAHDTRDRTPDLRPAFQYIRKKYGPRAAELMFVVNPTNALTGDPMEPLPMTMEGGGKWFSFWK